MSSAKQSVNCRVMPSGDGHWYWEVVRDRGVVGRGIAATESMAFEEANRASLEPWRADGHARAHDFPDLDP
jgi:hypothetical protein